MLIFPIKIGRLVAENGEFLDRDASSERSFFHDTRGRPNAEPFGLEQSFFLGEHSQLSDGLRISLLGRAASADSRRVCWCRQRSMPAREDVKDSDIFRHYES